MVVAAFPPFSVMTSLVPVVPVSASTVLTGKSSSKTKTSATIVQSKSILKPTTTISSVTPKTTSTSSLLPVSKKSILKK